MKIGFINISLIILLIMSFGCKKRYSDDRLELSVFERITHERTDDSSMEDFIDSLLLRMTLKEKIGQMTQIDESYVLVNNNSNGGTNVPPILIDSAKLSNLIQEYQIGSIISEGLRSAREWRETSDKLQRINQEVSSNKIPVILGINHIHGANYMKEGTIFPHQMNIGATFNIEFPGEVGEMILRETALMGHHLNFAPVLGIGEKKSWPRLYETYGEDTYLASVMGAEYIKGLQESTVSAYRIAACAKHFIGYSLPNSGWDRTAADISLQKLNEFLIPPFKEAIKANVMTIMVNSGEINGIPVHTSYHYLTTVLRDKLGFEGVAITDYDDIRKLHEEHHVTENEIESTYQAIMAGIDISITSNSIAYCDILNDLVDKGRIPEERIDLSVKRILRLKYKLGLFNKPFPSAININQFDSEEVHESAMNIAAESIVLLKNTNRLLPLGKPNRLTVIGMNADSKKALCGGWSYSWQGDDEAGYPDSMNTVLDALNIEFENTRITNSDRAHLRYYAGISDAVIVVTGESPYAEGIGNIDDMTLPAEEVELIEAALATNKPVILVLLEGRPRILGDLFDRCHVVLFAGLPGMFGGEALAGILSGRINPSGKMPITYPFRSGHMVPYTFKHTEFKGMNAENPNNRRYSIGEFGYGLSFTRYEYSELNLSDSIVTADEGINVTVKVKNIGSREGKESVLWFLSDEVGTYTRPVKQLKHFEKQFIMPGEVKEYSFTIDPKQHLGYPDVDDYWLLEDGYYTLSVGPLSARFQFINEE